MAKQSAGILLYRNIHNKLEVLLVFPGGPYFSKKDNGSWTIPKGEFEPTEAPLQAAIRELEEETGYRTNGDFIELTPIKQKGGKIAHCWAHEGNLDETAIISNTFELEWPPASGRRQTYPEIAKAAWFTVEAASLKINERQLPLLEELAQIIGS
ncbi:NUDIX domain-containing protein [Paraflavitalea sp. CAU 1676]|uniref:NUDIX domain-containing protein n=1 Tax=Paraflavitalea sp. CAU 1676 TaxID=3032598 RepID=UPI0023DAF4B1|nr:NUDIX domain-containing protein [Paraflavitalea sp. CAU 1676]MDF2190410.1 NUDIX domain-containing protein [Paraflavitalea sp. CAU 1676]